MVIKVDFLEASGQRLKGRMVFVKYIFYQYWLVTTIHLGRMYTLPPLVSAVKA